MNRYSLLLAVSLFSTLTYGETKEMPVRVSLVQLIATPERFEGKFVEVSGFLHLGFESSALCLHRDDCENRLYENSLWVSLSVEMQTQEKEINNRYVTLAGKFTSAFKGHLGLWPAAISDVNWAHRIPGT